MSKLVIEVENLSKLYYLGIIGSTTLRDSLERWWHRMKGKEHLSGEIGEGRIMVDSANPQAGPQPNTIWALKDVSFSVNEGEIVGVIGRNGAGKSTLLKLLSKITEPTSGRAIIRGRIASLLEVGTGFHPELTGRENIYLNGAILGMRKLETDRKFDEILAFAGVEKFIDTPVKHYSSGMYVRLAFAVAAHLEPEILIVDEVLSVGDAEFQKKCLGKMKTVSKNEDRTVFFVSHNMQVISQLCSKVIYVENGRLKYKGDVHDGINEYLKSLTPVPTLGWGANKRAGSGEYRFSDVAPNKEYFAPNERKTIRFQIEKKASIIGKAYVSAHIINGEGIIVAQCDSRLVGYYLGDSNVIEGVFMFNMPWLKPGTYSIDMFICCPPLMVDIYERACVLNVSPIAPYSYTATADAYALGTVFADYEWR